MTSLSLVLVSCALLGFRHGFDYDHIAAITDIAGTGSSPARTMRLCLMYALGHATTVAILGGIVIGFQLALPAGMDRWAERLVGLTLILLAVYVFGTLLRSRGRELPRTRASLLLSGTAWLHSRAHGWITRSPTPVSAATPRDLNDPGCFLIGIIHGLGAETPSQLALFLMASSLGGVRRGLLGLAVFLLGLLIMNTLMAASAIGLFRTGRRRHNWSVALASLTAAYSFAIGIIFLFGYADHLINISG